MRKLRIKLSPAEIQFYMFLRGELFVLPEFVTSEAEQHIYEYLIKIIKDYDW
jgi:hypothetical protein